MTECGAGAHGEPMPNAPRSGRLRVDCGVRTPMLRDLFLVAVRVRHAYGGEEPPRSLVRGHDAVLLVGHHLPVLRGSAQYCRRAWRTRRLNHSGQHAAGRRPVGPRGGVGRALPLNLGILVCSNQPDDGPAVGQAATDA